MSKVKKDKDVIIKIESQLVERVDALANRIENALNLVHEKDYTEVLRLNLKIAIAYAEGLSTTLEKCYDLMDGRPFDFAENSLIRDIIKKQTE